MSTRLLRVGILDSENYNAVSVGAQLMFCRLLLIVDDWGRHVAYPTTIHANCWMMHNILHPDEQVKIEDTQRWLTELTSKREDGRENLASIYPGRLDTGETVPILQINRWRERRRYNATLPNRDGEYELGELSAQRGRVRRQAAPSGPVELPHGFPKTVEEAERAADYAGCPKQFAADTWNQAMSRGGRDARGNAILKWAHHLAAMWAYQRSRKHEQQQQTRESGSRRNEGALTHPANDYEKAAASC